MQDAGERQPGHLESKRTERQSSVARRRKLIQKHLERRRLVQLESQIGSGSPQSSPSSPRPGSVKDECVDKYKDHFSFLRDSKFLEDLENDSVDSDIIEEELTALQETPISTREKVVKFLQSNPVQIVLCVIVLLDAGIVIAQILLDLNSVKDKLHKREKDFSKLLRYVRETHASKLQGYKGSDIETILHLLREYSGRNSSDKVNESFHLFSPSPNLDSFASTQDDKTRPNTEDNRHHHEHIPVYFDDKEGPDLLHDIAHGLHFASIAMLGLLVIEDLVKIIAMGKTFFKHKIEIFDAIIIIFSFAIDIVFLGGVAGEEGQKAAAVLVILLLWRIARVVDGIVVTVKQRQEFRIRLQKRARRLAEKKLETFEEEKTARAKQIEALKDLCSKAGVAEAEIAACGPKHARPVNTTLCALSSVARLSVSMTMLMSSGLYRPRKLDDGIVLPRVFVPRWAKASPSAADAITSGDKAKHHAGHKHHRHIKHKSGSSIESAGDEDKSLIPKNESLPIMQKLDMRRSKKLGASHSEDDGSQNRTPHRNHRIAKIRQQHSLLEGSPLPIDATQNLISRFPSGNEISRQNNRVHGDISEVSSSSSTPPETPIKAVPNAVDPDIPCLPNDNIQTLSERREEENASKSSLYGLPEESSEPPMDDNISLEKFGRSRRPDINIPSPRSSRLPTVRPCDVQIVIEHASDCQSSSPSPPPIAVPQRFTTSPPTPL